MHPDLAFLANIMEVSTRVKRESHFGGFPASAGGARDLARFIDLDQSDNRAIILAKQGGKSIYTVIVSLLTMKMTIFNTGMN